MSLLAIGMSHRTAPVSLLERAALDGDARLGVLTAALAAEPVTEAVLLSTCNRLELYANVEKFHAGLDEVSAVLAARTGVPLEELSEHLYVHYEDRAVHHLYTVACGLDSMVVGEGQILAQLKDALGTAQTHGTAGRLTNELFQQGLRVGKRAHTETGIDRAGQSLVTVGLAEVEREAGPVAGKRALVIGAGSMSSLAAATLRRAGVAELVVANRTAEKAERLAASLDGRAIPFADAAAAMGAADLVVSCTGAIGVMIGADAVREAVAERGAAAEPLALLDLALPRDVDAAAHEVDGAAVVDLERLAGTDGAALADDVEQVRQLIADEVEAFGTAQRVARITPTVVALRAMAADVMATELDRLDGRLPDLGPRERAEVKQAVHRVVDKLLHAPTVRVKELAGEPGGAAYAEALRELFCLEPGATSPADPPA
ncbi:glutamyl-tRNA reductase, partial [Mangrovactinospora gilvigrisea]